MGRAVRLELESVPDSINTQIAMTDHQKPTAGFWITVALVVVLVGYPPKGCS